MKISSTIVERTEKDYDKEKLPTTTEKQTIIDSTTLPTTTEENAETPIYPGITEKDFSTVNYYEDINNGDFTNGITTTELTETSISTTTTSTSSTTSTTSTTSTSTSTEEQQSSTDMMTTVSSVVTEKMGDWFWTQWSDCSKTCGHGLQRRVKHCSQGKLSFVFISSTSLFHSQAF